MKIDIHTIPQTLLDEAARAARLEGTLLGTAKDGSPACATVRVEAWRTA